MVRLTDSRRAGLAGLLAGAAGIVVGELAAALLHLRIGLTTAVAETIRDLTPGQLAVRLVHLVGHWDKPLLAVGVLVGVAAISWIAGTHRRGWAAFIALGLVALLAASTRPGAALSSGLPPLVATGTSLAVLSWLRPRAMAAEPEGRRAFVLGAAATVGLVAFAGGAMALARRTRAQVTAAARRYAPTIGAGTVPEGADINGAWRVTNDDFYRIDTALRPPIIDPDDWTLRLHGLVDRPRTFTLADLLARERTEAWVTLSCVSNPVGGDLVGNAYWSGVRIAPLLAEAGVQPGADAVLQKSEDGWTCGTPLSALTDDRNAMLAIGMNGEPLPIDHGFPVRMVVPGLYGFVSATKWLVDLEVSRFDRIDAYWTQRGWDEEAPFKTQSRIDSPRGGKVAAGAVTVGGTAWAPHTGIAKVELRVDEGPWRPCELGVGPDDSWVQWRTEVRLTPGNRLLRVRATDKTGAVQSAATSGVYPNGATGHHQAWISVT